MQASLFSGVAFRLWLAVAAVVVVTTALFALLALELALLPDERSAELRRVVAQLRLAPASP